MLSKEDNELVCRVGPGTPGGALLRRYWLPALLVTELPGPDCDPIRVRLLGEDLVAFRDTEGRIGLVGAHCPHRGASLFFGRNEENGLRCVYHGWKFDVTGRCVDMPNEPPESSFKDKIKHTSYPCVEQAGVVWTYMGPPERRPPMLNLEWMRLPAGHRWVSKTYERCNWLQALEGGIDTSHSSFLHSRAHNVAIDKSELRARARNPRLEVLDTDYGFTYAGIRHLADEGKNYVRVYQFVLPFHQMRAEGQGIRPDPQIDGHMWIPIDDEHTWVFNWAYRRDCGPIPEERWLDQEHRMGRGPEDLLPGFRLKQNIENDYLIDRALQRSGENYSGIPGVNTQDYAVQEGMGPIYDRTQEHLGTSDLAIIAARRMLLQSIRDLQAGREPAAPFADPSHVRPAEMVLPEGARWQDLMRDELLAKA
ncbi:MAG TPA: Rieske 2Fe-2S domain-containing protein [Chloroflexota bacterium]|nr:Rieske 2Fe-2S domain-containing protein [Chloroflexota bacterium]